MKFNCLLGLVHSFVSLIITEKQRDKQIDLRQNRLTYTGINLNLKKSLTTNMYYFCGKECER